MHNIRGAAAGHTSYPIKIERIPNRAEVGINVSLTSLLRSSYIIPLYNTTIFLEIFNSLVIAISFQMFSPNLNVVAFL